MLTQVCLWSIESTEKDILNTMAASKERPVLNLEKCAWQGLNTFGALPQGACLLSQ